MTHLNNLFFTRSRKDTEALVINLKTILKIRDISVDYKLVDTLGKGQFGKIKLGQNNKSKKYYSVKIIEKKNIKASDIELIRNELDILKLLRNSPHKNIVKTKDIYEDSSNIYIIMEYLKGGTLDSYLENIRTVISEEDSKRISKQIAMAVQHLHNLGIIHRDLKTDNIMLKRPKDPPTVKLIDFGLSRFHFKSEMIKDEPGALVFNAPEIIARKFYDNRVDIWSYGILVYYMNSGAFPFDGVNLTKDDLVRIICNEELCFSNLEFSHKLRDLIKSCLKKNPSQRICIEKVISSDWINDK